MSVASIHDSMLGISVTWFSSATMVEKKHVHRIVLSAASSALKLLLGETFSEGEHIRRGQPIKIAASGDVVGALIDHIYGGEPTVSPADAVELLRLAGAYELPKLVAEIESDSCCCFKTCL